MKKKKKDDEAQINIGEPVCFTEYKLHNHEVNAGHV